MKFYFIIFLIGNFLLQNLAYAQNEKNKHTFVVFPHIFTSRADADILISKYGQSYVDFYLNTHPSSENEALFISNFENAQKYFLAKSYDLATLHYKKVASLALTEDWKPLHRQAITLSMIRLSELLPSEKTYWIEAARNYGSDLDLQDFKITQDSKNLLSQHKGESLIWDVSKFTDTFDVILINGRIVSLSTIKKVLIPPGDYRIVFLSKTYKPHSVQVSGSQVPLLEPIRIPFVSGTCKTPNLDKTPDLQTPIVLFPDCQLALRDQKWENLNTKDLTPPILTESASPFLQNHFSQPQEPFYKKPWFIAAAVLTASVGVYFIVQNKRRGDDSSSSTVIGEF